MREKLSTWEHQHMTKAVLSDKLLSDSPQIRPDIIVIEITKKLMTQLRKDMLFSGLQFLRHKLRYLPRFNHRNKYLARASL